MEMVELALTSLEAHPMNSNVMEERLLAKLTDHIAKTGHYPPVIVRLLPVRSDAADQSAMQDSSSPRFQLLDGHHRVKALERLGHTTARCVVWDVDDEQALVLLATLNRLQGQDDPHKRASLLEKLQDSRGIELARLALELPERTEQLEALIALRQSPRQQPPRSADDLPVSVHFFLKREQRSELEKALRQTGGTREQALMKCVLGDGQQ